MRPQKIGIAALIALLTATLTPIHPNLPLILGTPQALAQSTDTRKAKADRLLQQGIQQAQTSQFQAALQSWEQALTIYREIKDRSNEGAALGNLGNAYYSLGDYAKAIDYQQQSLVIAREIKNRQGEGAALGNLGNAYYYLGDYAKAIDYHQQHLAIAREIKDRSNEGNALGNLGNAYNSLGDYAKAIDYQQQRLAITREIKDRSSEGTALGSLGNAYYSLGDYAKAIDYHQQSLAIAQEIKDRSSEGAALGNLGLAYDSLGDYAKAIDYQQQSLAIAREIKDRDGERLSLSNLGLAYLNSNKLAEAEKTLRTGIEVSESLRELLGSNDAFKVSIFEDQTRTYRLLQQVLIAQKKTDDALEITERGRARAFVELLASRLDSKEAAKILPPTIEQIKQVAKQQNATLVEYSIVFGDPTKNDSPNQIYIWVIKPTGEVAFRSVDLKSLNLTLSDISERTRIAAATGRNRGGGQQDTIVTELVRGTRGEIGAESSNDVALNPAVNRDTTRSNSKRLQQMHQLLIQPIADLLPTNPNNRVIFIPHESLFLVPFVALQDAAGKYLIEEHTISLAPSIQVLEITHKQRDRIMGKGVVVVGNPTMPKVSEQIGQPPQQLMSLPGAEIEAKAIAQILKTKALIGNAATKATFLKQATTANIIHLATHGLLYEFTGSDLPGAIALAPSGNDSGLLTSSEILKLKLNAQLVVLSACNTGRGKITGDGVIGLSRSLITAGVPSIVVSLWYVPDAPTASLMSEFYRQLEQNPDKAAAMRQAMLITIKKHPQPQNWAAFTLIGEAN
jgi:CHAT domain-containing protein/tetratricopeptide (TPR) repeat protein